jgi:hypothetical protein
MKSELYKEIMNQTTTKKLYSSKRSDRYIYVEMENDLITSINYWQGLEWSDNHRLDNQRLQPTTYQSFLDVTNINVGNEPLRVFINEVLRAMELEPTIDNIDNAIWTFVVLENKGMRMMNFD